MTGGIIASNFANHGEGGGLRVGGGTNAIIDASSGGKIYITNNKTNDNKDWGGGGIFIQQNGNLNILDVLVTNNNAGGFGALAAALLAVPLQMSPAAVVALTIEALLSSAIRRLLKRGIYVDNLITRITTEHFGTILSRLRILIGRKLLRITSELAILIILVQIC